MAITNAMVQGMQGGDVDMAASPYSVPVEPQAMRMQLMNFVMEHGTDWFDMHVESEARSPDAVTYWRTVSALRGHKLVERVDTFAHGRVFLRVTDLGLEFLKEDA